MGKQEWWKSTSAADDGARSDSFDDDQDWLDDFRFDDYEDDEDEAVTSIWNRYGSFRSGDDAARLAAAQRLAQGFVDTFATDTRRYDVTFNEAVGTAGTDFDGAKVIISHKPLFDPTIDEATANTVITAMAAHESSHVRYGKRNTSAARKMSDPRAPRLSNILEDVRIERRFSEDYPGYKGIFDPAATYVATSELAKNGLTSFPASKIDPLSRVSGALRYPRFVDWTGREESRDWWTAWGERWSRTDRPIDHVKAIEEGLVRLDVEKEQDAKEQAEQKQQQASQSQQQIAESTGGSGESQGRHEQAESDEDEDGQGASSDDASDDEDAGQQAGAPSQAGDDDEQDESQDATDSTSGDEPSEPEYPFSLPTELSDAIDEAADDNGETSEMNSAEAQDASVSGRSLTAPDADGKRGEVFWTAKGVARKARKYEDGIGAPIGAAAIRAAFVRSRRGHFGRERQQRSGRIDSSSLPRIASEDMRIFAKRTAPSEPHYRVWLMVDCSGSMSGYPIYDAARVAQTVAAATRFLPNVTLDIWGWTSGILNHVNFNATRVWASGSDLADIAQLVRLPMGGTPDAEVLRWAGKAIKKQCRPGEQPLIILASDGEGSLIGEAWAKDEAGEPMIDETTGEYRLGRSETIRQLRKSGVNVVSVAIGSLDESHQKALYGADGYVAWKGSIKKMAGPIGKLIARIAEGKAA